MYELPPNDYRQHDEALLTYQVKFSMTQDQ